MRIMRNNKAYYATLATYLNTKAGQAFMLDLASNVINGFEVDHKGFIKEAIIDYDQEIEINVQPINMEK